MIRFAEWTAGTMLALAGLLVLVSNRHDGDEHGKTYSARAEDSRRAAAPSSVGARSNDRTKKANYRSKDIQSKRDVSKLSEAYVAIQSQGDYSTLRTVLEELPPLERISTLYQEFPSLRSRLGNRYDLDEKLAIVAEFGGARAGDIRVRVFESTGAFLEPDADKELINSMDQDSWKIMARGSAKSDAPKAFELALSDIENTHRGIACAEAVKLWMGLDPMAASERINRMPKGALKDVALVEMVAHIISKGDAGSAKAWLSEFSDLAIAEKMIPRPSTH